MARCGAMPCPLLRHAAENVRFNNQRVLALKLLTRMTDDSTIEGIAEHFPYGVLAPEPVRIRVCRVITDAGANSFSVQEQRDGAARVSPAGVRIEDSPEGFLRNDDSDPRFARCVAIG